MTLETTDARPDADAALVERRRVFLASFRSASLLTHELEYLIDAIVERAGAIALAHDGSKIGVQRTPSRCAVQLGPVGLSASWIRAGQGFAGEGQLLVMQWEGRIGTQGRPAGTEPATLVREYVLRAEATGADDWRWRGETTTTGSYTSDDLVALCVDPLAKALRAAAPVASAS
jgi:hypothetical protein